MSSGVPKVVKVEKNDSGPIGVRNRVARTGDLGWTRDPAFRRRSTPRRA